MCFRPFLVALEGVPHLQINEVTARVADLLALSEADRMRRVAGGGVTVVRNRCGWARTALNKAGLVAQVERGVWRITEPGRAALRLFPTEIREVDLREHYPAFRQWVDAIAERARSKRMGDARADRDSGDDSLDDSLEGAESFASAPDHMLELERETRTLVEDELGDRLGAMTPSRFEWLVEQLVVRLGYGSSDAEVHAALKSGAGDSGVDGVIKEDRLGLGQIYLQAKRWQHRVGRPEIQSFVGAMHGRAQKGVFITTSDFSREAREYAGTLQGLRLRLVDGRELASLMIDCGLGVSEERVYRTYRIDSDFFEEGE
jgi:restriction system protein